MGSEARNKLFGRMSIVFGVAVAYWVAARLSLFLALPPGYATAIWPPSGIALGAALVWRRWGIIGIALGAVAWNYLRLTHGWQEKLLDPTLVLAVSGITTGVTLQAAAAAWMIRKVIGEPIALVRDHHVISFMLIGGPLACLISATISVGSLARAGTIGIDQIWFSWFTWWVGDSIGVLTFTPVVLMFFGQPVDLWRNRRWSIGLPMLVTFAATVTVFVAAAQSSAGQESERLQHHADTISEAFRTRLYNASNLLRACDGLYRSSEKVTRQEFLTFAAALLREDSGLKSLSAIERVDDARRDEFEQQTRSEGIADFRIKQVENETLVVPSKRRPVYYCITAIQPYEENKWAIGLDVGSRPGVLNAISAALQTGDFVVSERVRILHEADEQFGVVIYLPRFASDKPHRTVEERKAAIVGLNGAVFRLGDLVSNSTTRYDMQEVGLALKDITEPTRPQQLYSDARAQSTESADQTTRIIEFGGRRWELKVSRLHGYALAHQGLQSWVVLAGGLILTSLLGGLLMILTGRATLIASVVKDRTKELSQSNARLAREQLVTQEMMKELEASRDVAEEADRTKSAFIANMSHEIRTPMTAILGYTDLLLDPYLAPPARNGYAEVIRRNGEHLMEVVNDILDISKIEAGKLAVEMIPCSIDQIVRDVQTMMQPRAQQKGIEFSVEWKGDTSRPIKSDPIRVRQILINLVSNAIKFTDRGGVTLRVERQYGFIDMKVIDTGIGMSPQQIARVFEPFTQGDSTTTRRFGGTGLGLAISRHLSRLLGGELDVRSELNRGSTFQLRIPAIDVPQSQFQPRPVVEHSAQYDLPLSVRGKRILLAEDSADVREFLKQILIQAQFDVTAVHNGEALLDAALNADNGHSAFDLYLIDMQMPVVDGYEAARRIRAAGIAAPIIAITAHTLESDRQICLDAGCSDYIRKPVRRGELLQRIATALGVKGGEAELQALANPIRSELENDPIIADLLPVFIQELEKYMKSLHDGIAAHDEAGVRQLLHNVKGAASTFGFPQLGELAASASAELRVRVWGDGFQVMMRQLFELAERVRQSTLARERERSI